MPERRNPVVRAGAILRKGGVHTKSVTGQRHRQKLRVDDAIDEWYDTIVDEPAQDDSNVGKRHNKKGNKKGQSDTAPYLFCHRISSTGTHNSPFLITDH